MVAKVIPYSALVPEPTFWEWVCVTEDEGCGWERGSLGVRGCGASLGSPLAAHLHAVQFKSNVQKPRSTLLTSLLL